MAQDAAQKPAAKQNYAAKVRALLNKAKHTNTPQNEAEALMAKATALMARHNIDELQLAEEKGKAPQEIVVEEVDLAKEHGAVLAHAIHPLVTSMGAQAIMMGGVYTLVGTRSLLDNIWTLLAVMNIAMVNAANADAEEYKAKLRKQHPNWSDAKIGDLTDQHVWSFVRGYGKGVAEKIAERLGEVMDEAPGNALVLQTEAERIRAKFNELYPNRSKGKTLLIRDSAAEAAGRKAGRNADIGDARVGDGAVRALAG